MADEEKMHIKHRERLKEKFLQYGADALADHEFIELLLFYALPRQNTNEIAHTLINEYGSLAEILDTDVETLMQIKGISMHSATLFKVLAACINKYVNDKNNIINAVLTPNNINTYIKNLFYGHTNEVAYVILMDHECVVRKIKKLSTGSINAAPIYPREVVKIAVNDRYPYLMLAHNHPNGNEMPSESDLKITKTIELALSFVEVRLVDHVIVSGGNLISMSQHFHLFDD